MRKAALLAAIAVVGLVGSPAGAQVTLTLDASSVTGVAPGSTVSFSGTLFNPFAWSMTVVDAGGLSSLPFGAIPAVALLGTSIAPGASVHTAMFDVVVPMGTAAGTYTGNFGFVLGPPAGSTASPSLPFAGFQVGVATVPEPGTVALLAGGLAGLGVTTLRRRRAR